MKKKMSDRDKMLLYYVGAALVFAAVYFLVFTKLNEKKNVLLTENDQLQAEVTQLQEMEANKQNVLDDTADRQEKIGMALRDFPSEVRIQNAIYDLNEMYESINDVKIQSESYAMNQLFYQPVAGVDESGNPVMAEPVQNASASAVTSDTPVNDVVSAASNYTGYQSDVSVVFTAPYDSLKSVIDFINNSEDRMTITDISMTEVAGANDLSCNMTVSMYAISGTGEEYQQPEVKEFDPIGSVFGNNE